MEQKCLSSRVQNLLSYKVQIRNWPTDSKCVRRNGLIWLMRIRRIEKLWQTWNNYSKSKEKALQKCCQVQRKELFKQIWRLFNSIQLKGKMEKRKKLLNYWVHKFINCMRRDAIFNNKMMKWSNKFPNYKDSIAQWK
jgi:hypothetical protein